MHCDIVHYALAGPLSAPTPLTSSPEPARLVAFASGKMQIAALLFYLDKREYGINMAFTTRRSAPWGAEEHPSGMDGAATKHPPQ